MPPLTNVRKLAKTVSVLFEPAKPDLIAVMHSMLAEAMPICLVCEQNIAGHSYRQIASTPLQSGTEENLHAMISAAREHRWNDLSRFQEWEGRCPDAEVYLFRCVDGRYNLAVLCTAFDLSDIDYVLHQEQLPPEDLPASACSWSLI